MGLKKHRNEEGMKIQQDYLLLQKSRGKEGLEDSSTSVAWLNCCKRSRVVFQSFFTMTFL